MCIRDRLNIGRFHPSGKDRKYGVNGKMIASLNIVRTYIALWGALILSALLGAAPAVYAEPVLMKVQDGESAFIVDIKAKEIRWLTDSCQHIIPVQKADKDDNKPQDSISSERFIKDVQIGSHRFTLEQQFHFDGMNQTPTLRVLNSARGGWSEIDVVVERSSDPSCRLRLELPLCVD